MKRGEHPDAGLLPLYISAALAQGNAKKRKRGTNESAGVLFLWEKRIGTSPMLWWGCGLPQQVGDERVKECFIGPLWATPPGVSGEKRGILLRGLNGAVFEVIWWWGGVAMVKNGVNRSNTQEIRGFAFVVVRKEIVDHSNIVR